MGAWIAGASGAALVGSLFLPWYGNLICPFLPPCFTEEATSSDSLGPFVVALALVAVLGPGLLAASLTRAARLRAALAALAILGGLAGVALAAVPASPALTRYRFRAPYSLRRPPSAWLWEVGSTGATVVLTARVDARRVR